MAWIKLHDKLLSWEWHESTEIVSLWIHLLLMANYEDKHWHGITIPRGSFITTYRKLSEKTGISYQQLRTSLVKLVSTKEISCRSTARYTLITICNYDFYQTQDQHKTNTKATQTTESIESTDKEKISRDIKKKSWKSPGGEVYSDDKYW